mgnify:CR=1 FL=1
MNISFVLNSRPVSVDVDPSTRFVDLLREELDLTGTHIGCDTSQCGACLVMLDGESVKSCALLAASVDGCVVTTVEGLASPEGELHPMQQAFRENHGLQCGFCTPGMIMAAIDMVARHGTDLDEATVREDLAGHLCRCTGHEGIVKSSLARATQLGCARRSRPLSASLACCSRHDVPAAATQSGY